MGKRSGRMDRVGKEGGGGCCLFPINVLTTGSIDEKKLFYSYCSCILLKFYRISELVKQATFQIWLLESCAGAGAPSRIQPQ